MTQLLDPRNLADEAFVRRRSFVRYLLEGPASRIQVIPGREAEPSPQVTIIIPTDGYRSGSVECLLAQINQQTFQRFEVVIVRGDKRQGRAINAAAAIARGDILLTMDDDTRLGHDDLLEKIVSALRLDETIGIAGVSNLVPADASWLVRRAMQEVPRRSSRLVTQVTDSDMAEHPCLAIRKEIFYRIGGENELTPRGLDPYLRREVRRLGYRVVVIPDAWIHHLLPTTLRGILWWGFRNGMGSAYGTKFFPEFVIDQALDHLKEPPRDSSVPKRAFRYLGRWGIALFTLRWIYLGTMVSYALGYAWGMRSLNKNFDVTSSRRP
jgi:glycosyltransferase involved in cell wall biosynthesis